MISDIQPYELGEKQLMSMAEGRFLLGLAAGQQAIGTHAVEIGTFNGVTTANLARMLPRHKLITVSLPMGQVPVLAYHESDMGFNSSGPCSFPEDVAGRIEHWLVDSASLKLEASHQLGFCFIDGSHTYDYVVNDFNQLYPFVVAGGVMAFHDYGEGHAEVVAAVRDLAASYPDDVWCGFAGIAWCRKAALCK
jgi:methyltransferase family protein